MKKIVSADEAVRHIGDGASIMLGGFLCCGQPLGLVDALIKKGVKGLTIIVNDAGIPGVGVAKLIEEQRVARLITSYIGSSPEAGRQMHADTMKVELVPQGTLVERIRSAGAGLGAVVTPTGIGTEVEKGKQRINLDGHDYLIELPIHADFAFVAADVADKYGNGFISKARKNFNIVMAMAAQETILEAGKVVEVGELDPDGVTLPGVFVHTIVEAGK